MARDNPNKISGAPFRLSWTAIFGGMFASVGVWLLLHAFGLAIGFSRLEPTNPNMLRAAGIGGGVWSIVASMIALFVGGMVTARAAGFLGRGNGALHGIVLWGLTSLAGTVLLAFVVGSVATGAAAVGGEAASAAMSQVSPQGAQQTIQALGINTQTMVSAVNERLQRAGKPTVTAEQLDASIRDAVFTSLSEGRFDREVFSRSISQHTALSAADVDQIFGQTERELSQRFADLRANLERSAEQVARATARMFWGVFALLLLSLASSVAGAISGVSRRQRELSTVTQPPPLAPPPFIQRPGEAHL